MNDNQKKMMLVWLNDAHALEEGLITMLTKQVEEEKDGEMKAKLEEHLEETKHHAELVQSCIARYGEEPSGGKDFLSTVSSKIAGAGVSITQDKEVKNVHSSYVAEHTEIATYNIIRAAAFEFEDMETVAMCDEILQDENEMAQFLFEQIPLVTSEHMNSIE